MDVHDIVPSSVKPSSRQHSASMNKQNNKCKSLPNLTSLSLFQEHPPPTGFAMVLRSYSLGGLSSINQFNSSSRSQNQATHVARHHRPNSIHSKELHHLMRSNSAPSIGFAGTEKPDMEINRVNLMGRSFLRRTLSEVYVNQGRNVTMKDLLVD